MPEDAASTLLPPWCLPRMTIRPWAQRRTAHPPGIQPLDPAEWLHRDETYAAQMALRDALVAERPGDVLACLPEGEEAAAELRDLVIEEVTARHGAVREPGGIRRADGVLVPLDAAPIETLCRLAQEDFTLLARPEGEDEHVLVAGAVAFPSNWTLAEKAGRPLLRIHKPVAEYDLALGARVQRLHDGVRPGKPLWRANWNFSEDPTLFKANVEANSEARRRTRSSPPDWRTGWLRVERQTLSRLPRTGAAVFTVRTLVAPLTGFTEEDWIDLHRAAGELPDHLRDEKVGPAIRAEAARRAEAAAR